jgi:hypothetical protein
MLFRNVHYRDVALSRILIRSTPRRVIDDSCLSLCSSQLNSLANRVVILRQMVVVDHDHRMLSQQCFSLAAKEEMFLVVLTVQYTLQPT